MRIKPLRWFARKPGDTDPLRLSIYRLFWVVWVAWVISMLVGCGAGFEPTVEIVMVEGQPVVHHIDTNDAPAGCGDRTEWAGCHIKVNGVSHVWRSSRVAETTIKHEHAHALGMLHTPWERDFLGRPCATVVVAGGGYHVGQRICVDQRGEFTVRYAP